MTTTQHKSLVAKFASKYSLDPEKLLGILKATAFKVKNGEATNEQLAALLVVADSYNLNPFTKEIYAYPDKQNGIVPVVSVDGWTRIIQSHEAFNGAHFTYSQEVIQPGDDRFPGLKYKAHEWIEVTIHRKDRDHPMVIREFFEEVYRQPIKLDNGALVNTPWQSHDKRMHRHKTWIQGGRMAFGFAGIYDEDEAARILEAQAEQNVTPTAATTTSRTESVNNALAKRLGEVKGSEWNDATKPKTETVEKEAVVATQKKESPADAPPAVNSLPTDEDIPWSNEGAAERKPTLDWINALKTSKNVKTVKMVWGEYIAECNKHNAEPHLDVEATYHNLLEDLSS